MSELMIAGMWARTIDVDEVVAAVIMSEMLILMLLVVVILGLGLALILSLTLIQI